MACKKKTEAVEGLDQGQKKVLSVLNEMGKPLAPKQIAEAAGMESKDVSAKIKGLKKLGYVDSPVRCKYAITDAGKTSI